MSNNNAIAAIFHGTGQPLELRQVALPSSIASGEAIVRVTCCTLCGSDLSTLDGHRQEPTPCILGHEITGVIEAVGEGALLDLRGRRVAVNDRVVWSVVASCDSCRSCLRGFPQKCGMLRKYGHQAMYAEWELSGGLATHCHLIAGTKMVVLDEKLSPYLPDKVACLASCAISTVAAAIRTAGDFQGARVLVLGAGLLGLTACAMTRECGAESITICDTQPQRLALATHFAADQTLLWSELETHSNDHRFDIVLEMSGSVAAVKMALEVAAVGAVVVLVGSVRPTPPIELLPEQLVRKVQSLHGVHNYRPEDLLTAVDFLEGAGRRFPFAECVSQQYPLEEINEAIKGRERDLAIRIAINP